jgi:hypothetical protein
MSGEQPNFVTGYEERENKIVQEDLLLEVNNMAENHFEEKELFEEPCVAFEYGSTSLQEPFNYPEYKEKVEKALASGKLQLVNIWAIENMAKNHGLLHANLEKYDYAPVAPSIILIPKIGEMTKDTIVKVGKFTDCPLWTRKQIYNKETGEFTTHNGRGVSFFYPKNAKDIMPTYPGEFYQQFMLPPDGYLRDIRMFIVGDKVVPGFVRKAIDPITNEDLENAKIPSKTQYVASGHKEELTPVEGELLQQATDQTAYFRESLVNGLKTTRPFLERQDVLGFASVDFLIDKEKKLIAIDFDVGPAIQELKLVGARLAQALAEHLISLSKKDGIQRKIYIFGDPDNKFMLQVQAILLQSMPKDKLVFKKSLLTEAELSILRKKQKS